MGDDAGDGEVEGLGDVDEGFAVLEDGGDEFVGEVAVGAAVTAGFDAGRERRAAGAGEIRFDAFVLAVIGAALAADTPFFAVVAGGVPTDGHAGRAAFAGAEEGDFGSEGVFIYVISGLEVMDGAGHAHTGDFGEGAACDAYMVGIGMGRIPLGRKADAPVLIGGDRLGHIMIVFALGVNDFAEAASAVNFAHGVEVLVEIGGFEHHISEAAPADGLEDFVRLFEGAEEGGDGDGGVFAVLEGFEAMAGVAGGIRGDENGFNAVVADEFLEGGIGFGAAACLGEGGATFGNEVADGGDFDIGMVLKAEGGAELADAVADDADAELAVGNGPPALGGGGIRWSFFEALNDFFLSGAGGGDRGGGGRGGEGLDEGTALDGAVHG